MAAFCAFSGWWLIPLICMALFVALCFFFMHGRGGCMRPATGEGRHGND